MGKTLFEIWLDSDSPKPVFDEIDRRFSALETAREVETQPVTSEIRIRPDDMVMVKWKDEEKPRKVAFREIAFSYVKKSLEYISPIQPVKAREWLDKDVTV